MKFPVIWHSNSAYLHHIRWDQLPITHSGPIPAFNWNNAVLSAKDGLADDSTGSAAGLTITLGGWINGGGLDCTVKVRPPSLCFILLMPTGII